MLRSEMNILKIKSEEILVFLILTNITAFISDNLTFHKKIHPWITFFYLGSSVLFH